MSQIAPGNLYWHSRQIRLSAVSKLYSWNPTTQTLAPAPIVILLRSQHLRFARLRLESYALWQISITLCLHLILRGHDYALTTHLFGLSKSTSVDSLILTLIQIYRYTHNVFLNTCSDIGKLYWT